MSDLLAQLSYTFAEAIKEHRAIDTAEKSGELTPRQASRYKAELARRTSKE